MKAISTDNLLFQVAMTQLSQAQKLGQTSTLPGFLLHGISGMEQIRDHWWQLWKDSRTQDPFTRPDWVSIHVDAFENEASLLLACAGTRQALAGVLPLVYQTGTFHGFPVRRLRTATNAQTFRVVPLCHPASDPRALAHALIAAIEEVPAWDLLDIPGVPSGGFGQELERAAQNHGLLTHTAEDAGSILIPLERSAMGEQPWLAAVNSGMRSKLRKHLRMTESALGSLRLERHRTAESDSLALFYSIEASGWKGKSRTAISSDEKTRSFYDSIAAAFAKTGSFYLDILWAGDRPLAGSFSISYGNFFLPLKWGYDERYEHFSPGNLLVAELLRLAWEDGFSWFDMSPAAEYKKRWTHNTIPARHYYIFRGHYGRLLHAYKARLRPGAKAIFQRWMSAGKETDSSQ